MARIQSPSSADTRPTPRRSYMPNAHVREFGKANTEKDYLVFLSHSSRDAWIANMLAMDIRQRGCEVWLDTAELAGGDMLYSGIIEAVDACDEAIVVLSPYSLDSKWVLFEMGAICGQHKRLTPVLVHADTNLVPIIPGVRSIDINQLEQTFLPELERRASEKAVRHSLK
jgi:hypothetical protein